MIEWLFWPSLALLVYTGWSWTIATFWSDAAVRLCALGDVDPPK